MLDDDDNLLASCCRVFTVGCTYFVLVFSPQVLQHVRLPLLSPKFLVGTVGSDPLIKSDEECRCVCAPSPPFVFKDVFTKMLRSQTAGNQKQTYVKHPSNLVLL